MTVPPHSHGERSADPSFRSTARPIASAATSRSGSCLFSRPRPTTTPATTQSRAVSTSQDAGDDEQRRNPGEEVERRRAEQMSHGQDEARRGRADGRDELARRARTELAGEECDEHDDDGSGERGHGPEAAGRLPEQRFAEPTEKRCQRSLVVVARRRMTRGGTEVELVAVVAVPVRRTRAAARAPPRRPGARAATPVVDGSRELLSDR